MPPNFLGLERETFKTVRTLALPVDGLPSYSIRDGKWSFNLTKGKYKQPNSVEGDFSQTLEKIGDKRIRSGMIFCSDARTKIVIGANEILPITDTPINLFEGIEFEHFTIEFPADNFPVNYHSLLIVLSNSFKFPVPLSGLLFNYTPPVITSPASADAFATVFQMCALGYDQFNGIFVNTGGVNSLTYKIGYSMDGITFTYDAGVAVAFGASSRIAVTTKAKFIQLQVKATTPTFQSTYEFYPHLVK